MLIITVMRHPFLSLIALLSLSAPAFAGFEWVPPSENPTAPVYVEPAQPIQPAPEIIQSIRAYEKQESQPQVRKQAPQLPKVNLLDVTPPPQGYQQPAQGYQPPAAPKQNSLMINPMPTQATPSVFTENISGFGDNLPLALALSELVPPGFSYSFTAGVNPGASVSWDGKGRPWPEVVSEMLTPKGMMASFRGSVLIISPLAANTQAPSYTTSMTQAPVNAHKITPIAVQAPAPRPSFTISNAPRRHKAPRNFTNDGFMPMPGDTGNQPVALVPLP